MRGMQMIQVAIARISITPSMIEALTSFIVSLRQRIH